MKLIGTFLLIFALSGTSSAAINKLSHHSRANCGGFNESVSWELGVMHITWVLSEHTDIRGSTYSHAMASGWQDTWRNAEYHATEGYGGWITHGTHWMMDRDGRAYIVWNEYTDNCKLYDGWWNY